MDISCHSRKCPSAASQWISVPQEAVALLSHHTSVSSNLQMRVHSIIKYSSLWLLSLKKRMFLKSIYAVMCQQWISYCYWVGRNVEERQMVEDATVIFKSVLLLMDTWAISSFRDVVKVIMDTHKERCVYIFIFPE